MVSIRKLEPGDAVSSFRSGQEDLDRFLHRHAIPNQFDHRSCVTYLAIEAGEIVGFVTVAVAEGRAADFDRLKNRKLPRYPLPMLRLARMAVASGWRRKGLGSLLVRHVFGLALKLAEDAGCVGVVVDAKPEAIGYYRRLGFEARSAVEGQARAPADLTPMFLSIETIRAALP